ncbi:MAG TPA: ABC transporter ATP-binding protein [Acidobacteriota bacterium]|jgi:subfamily B ATP-binding cassette protein MsbA|nr:ABC transporter ATP-binding protein [Acidobacteriota bacterium]
MRAPFWKSISVLLDYKRQLCLALLGALVSAICFGAGLGMMLPALQLLLGEQRSLAQIANAHLDWPGMPQLMRQMARSVLAPIPPDPFWSFVTVMVVIVIFQLVATVGRYSHELFSLTAAFRAIAIWRDRIFSRLLHVPMIEILRIGAADNISRLVSDTGVLFTGYKAILGTPVLELFKGIAGLTVALVLDWRLTLIATAAAFPIVLLLGRFGKSICQASHRALQQHGRIIGSVQESLLSIGVVKVHNAEQYQRQRFDLVNNALRAEEELIAKTHAKASPLVEGISLLVVVTVATLAAWFIFRRNVDPARFITVLVALTAAAQSLKPLARLSQELAEAGAAAARLMEVIELPNERVDRSEVPLLPRHCRNITFQSVSFWYPGRDQAAIRGLTLTVRYGQTVAIVGPNGAGKTTLISLLPRLFEPASGQVMIDGIDIARVSLSSLRQQIALVPQENALFQGTIAQNIAYGAPEVPFEKVVAAAGAAYAHEFIMDLPRDYQTELGELGRGLSAGQKQRLAVARAVLRDPSILIFDEATSQIDPVSESKINQVLRGLRGQKTIFIIAHRLATIVDADLVVVMNRGRIVDTGTHDQLLGRCPAYGKLIDVEYQVTTTQRSQEA